MSGQCVSIWGFADFVFVPLFAFSGTTLLQSSFSVPGGVEQG